MTKTELIRFEYEHCAQCPNVEEYQKSLWKWKCSLKRRTVPELWGKIPAWCPLPDKEK